MTSFVLFEAYNRECKNFKMLVDVLLQIKWKLCDNIHVMRNCDQLLFSRQQINCNTVSSLLSLIYANLKSYRAAFFAYHVNMLSSIPARVRNYVRMSFSIWPHSIKFLNKLHIYNFMLLIDLLLRSLSITFSHITKPNSFKMFSRFNTSTSFPADTSFPLASRTSVLTIYEAVPLPSSAFKTTSVMDFCSFVFSMILPVFVIYFVLRYKIFISFCPFLLYPKNFEIKFACTL